jgi:putative monooxygenase ydhR
LLCSKSDFAFERRKEMTQKILQLNLTYSISRAELEAAWLEAAQPIAEVPGLRWKVWLMNEAEREAGGIWLFEGEAAAQSYGDGPIAGALKSSPVISNFSAKLFHVMESHTAITRGPVKTTTDVLSRL